MEPSTRAPQTTQRSDLTFKYSSEAEFGFWEEFSDSGLMQFESQAVNAWIPRNSRILDVGCGCGREALVLAGMGHHVFAMDVVPRMVETAMRLFRREGLSTRLVQGDVWRRNSFPREVRRGRSVRTGIPTHTYSRRPPPSPSQRLQVPAP